MRLLAPAALLAAAVLAATPVAAGGERFAKQLEQKAPTVVVLKLVLKIGEHENAVERVATVIDPAGVVMTTGLGSTRGGVKVAIESARVVFPGDEKEYDAVLGAFDSRLGLSFFRVKDLGGKKIASVNLDDAVEPKVGDELFGVSRLEDGFDYAPFYGTCEVVGQVTKPRAMWMATGSIVAALAHPLYAADGRVAGILIQQQGVSEGPRWAKTFLLPMSAAKLVIAQAVERSAKALEDAKAAAQDGADTAAPDAPPAMGGDDAKPGDGTPPGMGG
ncbi:MAG: hypothetical protein IT460_09370 [Planctomycetes bacterium]|nr:hypothetical protein [Planctomycetota bacterium]